MFVEGPSDEAVFRELAAKLGLDLARNNLGFVHMRGVRNFAHYAAEATLDLLARRKIRMFFVTDRDERDDAEVARMVDRLGDRATLAVLNRRELENYLLDYEAVASLIARKHKLAGVSGDSPGTQAVGEAIRTSVDSLKDEVVRLRAERRLLAPVFLNTRSNTGTIEERLRQGAERLNQIAVSMDASIAEIRREVDAEWPRNATALAPGTLVLEAVCEKFGLSFSKDKGDSQILASFLSAGSIPSELASLLREVAGDQDS